MEENHKLFKEILDNYNGSIIVADEKATILCCSKGTCALTDLSFEELIGKTLYELCERGIFSNSVIVECIEKKKFTQTFLYAHNNPDEGIYAYATPIFDENGKLIRVIAFSQDETASKLYYSRMENIYKKKISDSLNSVLHQNEHMFIAESPASKSVFNMAEEIAPVDTNVIIYGESGTGKEVLAQFIHEKSARKDQIFIPVNCASIPESLIESELFGYEKGSFTGADKNGKIGLFELANNGTIFLDEIGELPLQLQPKLLRVLENSEIRKLGSQETRKLDIRVIAATNRNLLEMVNEGTFRSDLYYRLNIFPLTLPPLHERTEDIEPLIHHFLNTFNKKYIKSVTIDNKFLTFAKNYHWPGNVRELKNLVQRYVITDGKLTYDSMIDSNGLNISESHTASECSASNHQEAVASMAQLTHKEYIQLCEREYFSELLSQTNGNISKISAITGLHVSGIYKKFEKLGIDYREYKKK